MPCPYEQNFIGIVEIIMGRKSQVFTQNSKLKTHHFLAAAMLLAALLGCNLTGATAPTATATATVTVTPIGGVAENTHVPTTLPNTPTASPTTRPAVIATSTPSGGAAATNTSVPAVPTSTRPAAAATATRPASTATPRPPTATWAGTNEVFIYLIAVGDNGATGTKIGCDDSAIAVKRVLASATQAPLRAAITELLSLRDQNYGESGFYNALYQSSLTVSDVNIRNRVAIIQLTGTLTQGGACDAPRIKAQLEFTATQFTTVDSAQITINGTALDTLLSSQ